MAFSIESQHSKTSKKGRANNVNEIVSLRDKGDFIKVEKGKSIN